MSGTCLPEGVSQAEFLDAVRTIQNRLAKQFASRMFNKDDVSSLIALHACEGLKNYDRRRPLAPFLYSHCRLRLINHVRDTYRRADAPCRRCHSGDPCGPDGRRCAAYVKWERFQTQKAAVRQPKYLESDQAVDTRVTATAEANAETTGLRELIDLNLPVELRESYLRMLSDEPVEHSVRRRVRAAVLEVLQEAGVRQDIVL
jgi:hypothetical protein